MAFGRGALKEIKKAAGSASKSSRVKLVAKSIIFAVKALVHIFLFLLLWGLIYNLLLRDIDICHLPLTLDYKHISNVNVPATSRAWTKAGVLLEKNEQININVNGKVRLCESTRQDIDNIIPATTAQWQPTGIYAVEGQPLSFKVKGKYSQFADNKCPLDNNPNYTFYKSTPETSAQDAQNSALPQGRTLNTVKGERVANTGRWLDNNSLDSPCFSTRGKGVFVHIGEPSGGLDSTEFGNPGFEGVGDRFFELFSPNEDYSFLETGQYIASGGIIKPDFNSNNGTLKFKFAPASGQIYIRYAEIDPAVTEVTVNTDWQWPTDASAADNRGGYDVKVISNCESKNGRNLIAYISENGKAPSEDSLQTNFDIASALELLPESVSRFSGQAPLGGQLFFKIVDIPQTNANDATGDGIYGNNGGEYYVTTRYKVVSKDMDFFDIFIDPVRILLHGQTVDGEFKPGLPEQFFTAISGNGTLIVAIQAAMTLAIALYAFMYVTAGKGGSLQELITFAIRLGIIIALISEDSWAFFYKYLFQGLMGAIDDISYIFISVVKPATVAYVENDYGATGELVSETVAPLTSDRSDFDKSVFGFLSLIIDFIAYGSNWGRLLGFLTHSFAGIIIALMLAFSIALFLLTVYRTLLTYLAAMIFLGLLIGMGPIFIIFILFSYTRKFSHLWLRTIAFYALQPIMLLSLVSFFSVLYFNFIYGLFNFTVCIECIWSVPIPTFGGEICLLANYAPWVASGDILARTVTDLVKCISLFTIATAMYRMPDFVYKISFRLTAAPAIPDAGGKNSMGSAFEAAGKQAGITAAGAAAATPGLNRLVPGNIKQQTKYGSTKQATIEARKKKQRKMDEAKNAKPKDPKEVEDKLKKAANKKGGKKKKNNNDDDE